MATAIGVGVSPFLQKPGGGWADAIIALTVDYPATQLTFKFKLPSTKTVTLYWGNGESEAVIGQDAVEITKISLYTEPGLFKFWVSGDVTDLTHIDINSQDFVSGNIDRWAELTNLTFLSAWGTDITVTDVSVFAALTSLTTLQLSMTNTSGNAATLYPLTSLTTLWLQITDVEFIGSDAWTNDAADLFFEDCAFASPEVNNLIEALSTCTNCAIDVSGTNAARTTASNGDLDTLLTNVNTINYNYPIEYRAVYDAMTNTPTAAIAVQQDVMVGKLVAGGVWTLLDAFYLFAQQSNADGEALINWINPGTFDATLVNAPAFASLEGFTGDGASAYINTNYNPNTQGINYQLDDSSCFIYQRTDKPRDQAQSFGILSSLAGDTYLVVYYISGTDKTSLKMNDEGACEYPEDAVNKGFYFMQRTGANAKELFLDNISKVSDAEVSVGVPDGEMYIFCRNVIGTGPSNFSNIQASCFGMGNSLNLGKRTILQNAIEAYMDSNGKGIIP